MFTVIVQTPTGVRLLLKLMLPLPAAAAAEPPQVLMTPGVAATCKPVGRVSVKLVLMATTFGLLMLKVRVVVPFTGMEAAPKLLTICGGSKITMPTLAVPPLEAPNPAVGSV